MCRPTLTFEKGKEKNNNEREKKVLRFFFATFTTFLR